MTFRIPTLLFFLLPRRFLQRLPQSFDIERFSEKEYSWKRDPLWGLWDHAKTPEQLVEIGEGDCVDYSRLSASFLYYHTTRPVYLISMFRFNLPTPGHMIVYDGQYIYSSGEITEQSIEEFMKENGYEYKVTRTIRNE